MHKEASSDAKSVEFALLNTSYLTIGPLYECGFMGCYVLNSHAGITAGSGVVLSTLPSYDNYTDSLSASHWVGRALLIQEREIPFSRGLDVLAPFSFHLLWTR